MKVVFRTSLKPRFKKPFSKSAGGKRRRKEPEIPGEPTFTSLGEKMISAEDFHKVEMRVGRIIDVQDYPEARNPAYKLTIDFGSFGIKKSSAQLCSNYSKEELIGGSVIAVTNFHPKQIGNFMSQVLVLGLPDEKGECILLKPEKEVELGSRVY